MDHRLTFLAFAVYLAISTTIVTAQHASAPGAASESHHGRSGELNESAAGAALMEQVVRQISQHQSIAAQVRHRSRMFGQQMVGAGRYLQQKSPQGLQINFALSVKSGDRAVSLLHVCDGRFLWMHDTLKERPQLSRVDLVRLRRAGAEQGGDFPSMLAGGGLPRLLHSIQQNFDIAAPQAFTFQDVPVWALACHWKPSRLAALLPQYPELLDDQGRVRGDELPAQFPDRIFLLVGQDDLFPYRVDFRRSRSEKESSLLDVNPAASSSLTTMELFEVQFDAPLDPGEFVYSPTNIEIHDRTDEMLKQIRESRGQGEATAR